MLYPPPAPRRPSGPKFRLLEEEPQKKPTPVAVPKPRRRRRRGPWLKRLTILLLVAGVGAGGYWYFALRKPHVTPPWVGWLDRAKQFVSKITARKPAPPPPATARRRPAGSAPPAALPPAAVPPPITVPQPVTVPHPVTVPQPVPKPPAVAASPFARFDRLSDSLSHAVRNFHDRAALFENGRMDCGGLATGLVAMENLWMTYNAERRARMASFDQRRATQDQAMYAAVDSVESRYEHSGCPRP